MAGSLSGTYSFDGGPANGINAVGTISGSYGFDVTDPTGEFNPVGSLYGFYSFNQTKVFKQLAMPDVSTYYDRFRIIIEDVHGNILARDVVGQEVRVFRQLSGPCKIEFKIHYNEPSIQADDGSGPIQLKPWAHWIHIEKELLDGSRGIIASGIVQPSSVDPKTGVMSVVADGFAGYPKGLPWLVNWNPIAVDIFEIVENIWNHIQSYPHGNLGVTVYPTRSGTLMLPGFSFENEILIQNFFAIFIREVDRIDCGDYINRLSKDIPIDYFERSAWNSNYTAINKSIELAYPHGGILQSELVFRPNENIISATPKTESDIEWISDITIRGWFPTKEYSHTLANADPDRYRRVLDESDVRLDSNERNKAWAHRRLSRRQIPKYYEEIIIDPYHSNAPFGSWDVGDTIIVSGEMPWVGNWIEPHRILAWSWDEKNNQVQMRLMAEGAFNYDPVEYIE